MRFENARVMNFDGALRGMRNPLNSWDKSDSFFGMIDLAKSPAINNIACFWLRQIQIDINDEKFDDKEETAVKFLKKNGILQRNGNIAEVAFIGPADMQLAMKLVKTGAEHRKFLRQIFVSVDITAPLYWWKEADTYKINTTANSTSTMHKLASTPITLDCFETDDIDKDLFCSELDCSSVINTLEKLRLQYIETKDKKYWKELIRWLPESWLQTRTWTCNYENLKNIYSQRRNHKLSEWHQFCDWVKTLPYAENFLI